VEWLEEGVLVEGGVSSSTRREVFHRGSLLPNVVVCTYSFPSVSCSHCSPGGTKPIPVGEAVGEVGEAVGAEEGAARLQKAPY